MSDKANHTILLVDDESGILHALQRLLKVIDAKVLTANCADEALIVIKNSPVSLIISDNRMPGKTGVELLTESRQIQPSAIRILLTGYADLETVMQAINSGAIRYYLTKPWDDDLLLSRVKESLELFEMKNDNQRLNGLTQKQNDELKELNRTLEQKVTDKTKQIKEQHEELARSFMETIKAFSSIIDLRFKEVGSHSQRVAASAKKILRIMNLNQKEYQDIVVAAFLHDIGKISYPDGLLKKSEGECNRAEMEIVTRHPILGQSCVFVISGFEEIGMIIRNHHENFDGSGFPDNIRETGIPLGARIIRVADAFDHKAFFGGYPDMKMLNEAAAYLVRESGILFDPEVVKKFIDLDIARQFYQGELMETIVVKAFDLQKGMVVAEDIYTHSGMFVLPKGAGLSSEMINRIIKIDKFDSIQKGIVVHKANRAERKENAPVQSTIGR
jgi:response regulator RpfG family c-di-GMP phosphodiesterase